MLYTDNLVTVHGMYPTVTTCVKCKEKQETNLVGFEPNGNYYHKCTCGHTSWISGRKDQGIFKVESIVSRFETELDKTKVCTEDTCFMYSPNGTSYGSHCLAVNCIRE